jgi:hypothetical protein
MTAFLFVVSSAIEKPVNFENERLYRATSLCRMSCSESTGSLTSLQISKIEKFDIKLPG